MISLDSPRSFSIWAYTVSHGTLIIRSTLEKHKTSGKRIDLIFKDTQWIQIPTLFECDTVKQISEDGKDYRIYKFYTDNSLIGKVYAGALYIEESQKIYNQKTEAAPYL